MKSSESYRKLCLKQQTELRRIMMGGDSDDEAIQLFLRQHAMLHSGKVDRGAPWSFEDEVFMNLTDAQVRKVPSPGEPSIAWIIWHIARIEDVAMNLLVADTTQIINQENWLERMNSPVRDTGNAMDEQGIGDLSARIDVQSLRAYRLAVGRRTRVIVRQLDPDALNAKVDSYRLEQVMAQGALVEAARAIADYWSRRNIAGLLLMPATRHNIVHLNEALRVKKRVAR